MEWVNADIEPSVGEKLIVFLTNSEWTVATYEGDNRYISAYGTKIDGWSVEYWMQIRNPHRPKDTELRCRDCEYFNFHREQSPFNNRWTYCHSCENEKVRQKNHCPSDEKCKHFKERKRDDEEQA